jgi:hypothetical protein
MNLSWPGRNGGFPRLLGTGGHEVERLPSSKSAGSIYTATSAEWTDSEGECEARPPLLAFMSASAKRMSDGVTEFKEKFDEDKARYVTQHRTFFGNATLAMAVAVYTAIFALPSYMTWANYELFGTREVTRDYVHNLTGVDEGLAPVCDSWAIKRQRNIAPPGHPPVLVPHNASMSPWNEYDVNDVWCGWLPTMYQNYWGNAAQMIIFTVYLNTGTTVMQGWQGMIGTSVATFNAWLMEFAFEMTSLKQQASCKDLLVCSASDGKAPCKYENNWWNGSQRCAKHGVTEETATVEMVQVYQSDSLERLGQGLLLSNVVILIFLFLISGAGELTIKFGLSWHIYYMMQQLNVDGPVHVYRYTTWVPCFEWDSEYMAVLVTSLLGTLIAIGATIFNPTPLKNINRLDADAVAVTNATNNVLKESITYMSSGLRNKTAKRFQLVEKIEELSKLMSNIKGHLADSWWEVFDIGHYKTLRSLYEMLEGQVTDVRDVMYALKNTVLDEEFAEFQRSYPIFVEKLVPFLEALFRDAAELQKKCVSICLDGTIGQDEREELQRGASVVKKRQFELLNSLSSLCPHITEELANERIFVFAVSLWARKATDLASMMAEQEDLDCKDAGFIQSICLALKTGFKNTWAPSKVIGNAEHRNFALRNTISISTCFLIGLYANYSIFKPYSSNMAITLALLISHFSGSAMQKNLQRLLGVSLGKCLPIIIFACMAGVPCDWNYRFLLQGTTFMMFVFTFCYMYYTSAQWSLVGCLIAGFGTPMLMTVCAMSGNGHDDVTLAARYTEIGQVTAAILIQTLVDWLLTKTDSRHMAIQHLQCITDNITEGYAAFFDADLTRMKNHLLIVDSELALASSLAHECDPKLEVIPGISRPFKFATYLETLEHLQRITSDLRVLVVAAMDLTAGSKYSEHQDEDRHSTLLDLFRGSRSLLTFQTALTKSMDDAFTASISVLSHFTEDEPEVSHLKELEETTDLPALTNQEQLYTEINSMVSKEPHCGVEITDDLRVCICVALRSLRNASVHTGELTQLVVRHAFV